MQQPTSEQQDNRIIIISSLNFHRFDTPTLNTRTAFSFTYLHFLRSCIIGKKIVGIIGVRVVIEIYLFWVQAKSPIEDLSEDCSAHTLTWILKNLFVALINQQGKDFNNVEDLFHRSVVRRLKDEYKIFQLLRNDCNPTSSGSLLTCNPSGNI